MRKIVLEFIRRGLVAGGFGPLILAVVYLVLQQQGVVQTLTVNEVCLGTFSVFGLAFFAGGINVVHQIERIPLMMAILIQGSVLYICYLSTYLLNGWIESGMTHILVFSGIFGFSYLVIWVIIYCTTKKKTDRLNEILKQKQQSKEYGM